MGVTRATHSGPICTGCNTPLATHVIIHNMREVMQGRTFLRNGKTMKKCSPVVIR